VESQTIANGILKSLKTKVLDSLKAKGIFYDPLEEEVIPSLPHLIAYFFNIKYDGQ